MRLLLSRLKLWENVQKQVLRTIKSTGCQVWSTEKCLARSCDDVTEQAGGTPQAGVVIAPQITLNTAKRLVRDLYKLQVTAIEELNGYVDKNYKVEVLPHTDNPHIKVVCKTGYVLKVLNSMDTQKQHVEAECEVVKVISEAGIRCPIPELNIHGTETSIEKLPIETDLDNTPEQEQQVDEYSVHLVRLMKFIPGKRLVEIEYGPELLYQTGKMAGQIDKILMGFSHPGISTYETLWSLSYVPRLTKYLHVVTNPQHKKCCQQIIEQFNKEVVPNYHKFQTGVIHGDFNDHNVIVAKCQEKNQYEIAGIIDFGDSTDSYIVFEPAIAIMYLMLESRVVDLIDVGGHVLKGYSEHITLNEAEKDALLTLVLGRYCQSLVLGAYSHLQDPGNEYLLSSADSGWEQLLQLWNTPKQQVEAAWRRVMEEDL